MEVNCRLSSLATAKAAEAVKAVKVPKEKTKACMAGSGKATEDSPSRVDVSLCVSDAPGLVTRVRIAASLPSHARSVVVTIRIPCTPSQICGSFGQRRALLNDAKGRQNPRAASAIPMSSGGESMADLTAQAQGLDIEDHEEDELGASVTFAPALPISSVVHDDQSFVDVAVHLGGDSVPDLSHLADIFVDTSSTTTFAVAVPHHLNMTPIHDRARRMFWCATSTSI